MKIVGQTRSYSCGPALAVSFWPLQARQREAVAARALACQEFPPDDVQVVPQHAPVHIAQIAAHSHVQATVQSVFPTVDLAFHRAVRLAQCPKLTPAIAFPFRRVHLPAFGLHHFRNTWTQQLTIRRARKALVETQARHAAEAIPPQQPIGHRDALILSEFFQQGGAVLNQLILIGRDQEFVAQLAAGSVLAFLDPSGVRLEDGEYSLGRWDILLVQQPAFQQVQKFVEHCLEGCQFLPARGAAALIAELEQVLPDLVGGLVTHGQIRTHD